jgi:hypothetical protein
MAMLVWLTIGGGWVCLCSYQIICNHVLIIVMAIGRPHHFVISLGCHIDEIKRMKINTFHLVTTSLSISHMSH